MSDTFILQIKIRDTQPVALADAAEFAEWFDEEVEVLRVDHGELVHVKTVSP